MTKPKSYKTGVLAAGCLLSLGSFLNHSAQAEVTRVEISRRADVGSGYEKIIGTLHFAIDPKHRRNAVIADIDKAPVIDRRVEFSADLYILRPKDAARANGVALVDVANRGNKISLPLFNRAARSLDPTEADLGDGFLMQAGYTLVWVGWQFDVLRDGGRVKLDAPVAKGLSGTVKSQFVLNRRVNETTLADLAGYSLDAQDPNALLTVRDGAYGERAAIDRAAWRFSGNTLTLDGGFEPGRTYEVSIRATDLPVVGTGLAAFRDASSWLKYAADSVAPVQYAYAFGESQSGRFLRSFLYYGFNADEQGRQVFDGAFVHIAGGARLSINERGATPNASKAPSGAFPFADIAMRDPVSKRVEGLLDNERARATWPKIFYTNSAVEYWSGDRSAALVHTSADGKTDLTLPQNTRVYFLTGTQHVPARFPASATTGQQPPNPVEHAWTLRALLTAMDKWVRLGVAPPASQHPRLADGTLVSVDKLSFPAIPGVQSPASIPGGREGEVLLPHLVAAVDVDGNERSGIRTAEHAVPVATYTGWNFRSAAIGAPNQVVALMGSAIPFARTPEARSGGDKRLSLVERYGARDRYLELARAQCALLVEGGYLLQADVPNVMQRMTQHWDGAMGSP